MLTYRPTPAETVAELMFPPLPEADSQLVELIELIEAVRAAASMGVSTTPATQGNDDAT